MTSGAEAARSGKQDRKAGRERVLSVMESAEAWTSRKRFARGPGMGCEGSDCGCGSVSAVGCEGASCETGSAEGVAIVWGSRDRLGLQMECFRA